MGSKTARAGVGALVLACAVGAPSIALAHALMITPAPRDVGLDTSDEHKNGPCGAVARNNAKCTQYAQGATINVKWQETVPHQGCFQWLIGSANDTNFVTLKQINDPAGGQDMVYTDTITLPPNFTCENCTLTLRQLMLGAACGPDAGANATGPGDTYFSCSDVRIGDFPAATPCPAPAGDAGPDGGSTTPGTDGGGPTTTPTDGGGKFVDGGDDDPDDPRVGPNLRSGEGGGCSVALGATSGVSFVITGGLLGAFLLRLARRRRK